MSKTARPRRKFNSLDSKKKKNENLFVLLSYFTYEHYNSSNIYLLDAIDI